MASTYSSSLHVSEYSLSRETEQETVSRLEKMFLSSVLSPVWKDWRKHADEDFQFYEGDQWTAFEKAVLQERGQPDTVENLIKPKVERLLGQFQRQHSTVQTLGRNVSIDEQTAATASDIFRWVDQSNGTEFEEGDAVKDKFIGGFGVLECCSYLDPLGHTTITIRNENPFYIFPDPHSRRYDWNEDAKFIARSKWLDLDDAIALWPKKAKSLRQCCSSLPGSGYAGVMDPQVLKQANWNYFDPNRERLRPVELYYKRKVLKRILITPTGVSVELDYLGPRQAMAQAPAGSTMDSVVSEEMWLGIYCGGLLIYHDRCQDQDGMFPFIPYFGDRKKSGEPFGPVRNLVPLAKEINKRRSKALNLLSTNQAIAEQNAVEDWAEFTNEKAKPDGVMKVRKLDAVELIKNQDMGQSQMAMHQESKQAFNMVSGDDPTNQGQASQMRSGIGKAREQMATDLVNMPLFSNIRRSRRIKLKKVWGLVCQHFTDDLIFQITDDPNAAKVISVPKDKLAAMREMAFNFVISDVEDSLTLQTEQFQIVAEIFPQILPLGIGPAKFLLELSNIKPKQKEGLMKMLDDMAAQPPPEPKISLTLNWGDMQPEERAIFAKNKLNMPELAAFLLEQGEPSGKRAAMATAMEKQASVERMNDKRQEVELITHGSQLHSDMIGTVLDHKAKMAKAEADKRKANASKSKSKPSYQMGTDFVPETGPATLHRGEMVIPKEEAEALRAQGFGLREDKTEKGMGYFGLLRSLDPAARPGTFSSELSYNSTVDGQDLFYPILAPGLSRQDIEHIMSGKEPTDAMHQKAIDHALMRIKAGLSPFAGEGEQGQLP